MISFDKRVKQAAQLIQPDVRDMGDIQLLAIVVNDLLPLSDDERRGALDEFDIGAYNRRLIWESLHPELVTTPCWQWAGELGAQDASNVRALSEASSLSDLGFQLKRWRAC